MDKTIQVGNKYKNASGYNWGEVLRVDRIKSEVGVLMVGGGIITFGLYEMQAWINESILTKIN
jgi:hypothetical protein